jgi:hypothetical protein
MPRSGLFLGDSSQEYTFPRRKILGEKGSWEKKVPRRKILGENGS